MSIQFLTSLLQYDELSSFQEGLCAICKNGLWGFIDNTGKEVIAKQYEWTGAFLDGLVKVVLNGETGHIDNTGKFYRLPDKFKNVQFYNGLSFVKINNNENGCGFIDKTGELIIPELYWGHTDTTRFKGDYAVVYTKGMLGIKWKIIDKRGMTVFPKSYKSILYQNYSPCIFSNLLILEQSNKPETIINLNNNFTIDISKYKTGDILRFVKEDTYLPVYKHNQWGFIDMSNGKIIIPFEYDMCLPFRSGLAFVKKGNWKCFIDKSGKIIIDNYQYDVYSRMLTIYGAFFHNGFLSTAIKINDEKLKFGLIDKTGREIIPPEYDEEIIINENVGKIEKNGQSGFVYLYPTSNGVVPIFCFEPFYGNDSAEIIIDKTKVKINRNGQLLNDNNGYIHPEILADFNSRSPSYHQNNDDYKSDNFKSDDSKVENFQQKLNIPLSDIPLWIKIFPELEGYSLDKLEKFLLQQTEICCYFLEKLPESIGQLQNLQTLSLFYCNNLTTLPESIGQLQNLQKLSLSYYDNLTTLPESIGQLQNLQKLYLICKNLTTLPESIGQLQNLQELYLTGCKNLTTLPESIGQLQNLQKLYLADCKNLTTLPESIGQLQNLQKLNLADCEKLTLPKNIINLSKHCEIITDN
ncbi:MAG: WG repeat-containing protein [Neisseriaceae bacterium]|nr:WG repeat-containing protein [Neisseriaceae bacterium]